MNYKYRLFFTQRKLHLAAADAPTKYICGVAHRKEHQLICAGKKGLIYSFMATNKICLCCLRILLRRSINSFGTTVDMIKVSGKGEGTERMKKLVDKLRGKRRYHRRYHD